MDKETVKIEKHQIMDIPWQILNVLQRIRWDVMFWLADCVILCGTFASVIMQIIVLLQFRALQCCLLRNISLCIGVFYVLYRLLDSNYTFMYNINSNTRGATKHQRQMDPTHWICKKTHKYCRFMFLFNVLVHLHTINSAFLLFLFLNVGQCDCIRRCYFSE